MSKIISHYKIYIEMAKKFRRKKKHRGNKISNRISKLENQMIPIIKSFENRFVDNDPNTMNPVDISNGGLMYTMGKLVPTTPENQYTFPPGASQTVLPQNLRIGDKITVKSYRIRGQITCALGVLAGDANNRVRLMAVHFPDLDLNNPGNNTAIVLQKVLQFCSAGSTVSGAYPNSAPFFSPYKNRIDQDPLGNQVDLSKYKVLYDKTFRLTNTQSVFTGGVGSGGLNSKECWRHDFDINLKFPKGHVVTYSNEKSAVSNLFEPQMNNIVILAVSDSAIQSHPTMTVHARLKYMDA